MATIKLKTAREKLQKLELERERLALDNAKTKQELISRREMADAFSPAVAVLRSRLVFIFCDRLPQLLDGKSAGEMRPHMETAVDEALASLREFGRTWEL